MTSRFALANKPDVDIVGGDLTESTNRPHTSLEIRHLGIRPMDVVPRLTLERELLLSLLDLAQTDAGAPRIRHSLGLLGRIVGAQRVYVELYRTGGALEGPRWSLSVGCTDVDEAEIHALTSRGIVAAALASGDIIHTAAATLDERFRDRESVQERSLEAVLCCPLGQNADGVLYVEGKPNGGPFAVEDVELARVTGRCLAPLLEGVASREAARAANDPTRPYRDRLRLDGIVGRSPALATVFHGVSLAAPANVTVLITGASGTGKTQVARAIHDNGPRAHGPFVELNCAALPEGLIESELFGTVPGAFPGARKNPGKVEAADGGTLFLDEVGEIPITAQAKLLQVLQSRQFFALGSTKALSSNVRVIAATNQDLEALVAEKKFREDLFFRLSVLTIRMPALSERRPDLPDLVVALLQRATEEHGGAALTASDGLTQACLALDLPGNIRQLRSRLVVALLRAQAEGSLQVEARHLEEVPGEFTAEDGATFHAATRAFQREFLARELNALNWNVAEVARRIDLTRAHIYNLIRELGLRRPPSSPNKETA